MSLLFTSLLRHGYLPAALMQSAIVPILKNRQGDTSDKNIYRPIAIVTAISKMFELCLMKLMESYLVTRDNQFGFKKKHSTDLCIFSVKSVIKYYNLYKSPVYSCFLDASKAYDHINHWTLFKKLLKRGISVVIVRIYLCYDYSIEIDMNFNALKSYCIAFTPKLYKLTLPSLHINSLSTSCTDSIKYLGYMFSSNHSDDTEMLRQMRLLYCRSNRLFKL